MRSSELSRVERLGAIFGARAAESGVLIGIGDDAAVLAACDQPLVWTVDAAVEGTHFRREWLSFEDIGYRSTMAAASDLAAMAAEPLGVLSALVLPDDIGDDEMAALAAGQEQAAAALGTAVVGGNLARGRELSITTTVLGRAPSPLLRRGARPGDALWLVGPVGLAAAGLRFLMEGRPIDDEVAAACVAAWRRPRAQIPAGLALRGLAAAAIDVSDGLARDVGHLAAASRTVAVIDIAALLHARNDASTDQRRRGGAALSPEDQARGASGYTLLNNNAPSSPERAPDAPSSPARAHEAPPSPKRPPDAPSSPKCAPDAPSSPARAHEAPPSPERAHEAPSSPERTPEAPLAPERALHAAAARLGVDAAQLALFGGEDYALAVVAADGVVIEGGVKIGTFEPSPNGHGGVLARWPDGAREELREGGFDHFTR